MCEGVCLQNEGIQEAVCEDRVRQVERLMMMRGTALNAKRMQLIGQQVVLHPTANAAER
jgi:hypothetical protein